jgi:hypothetical protein
MPTKTLSKTRPLRKQSIVISPEEAELIDEALSSVERRLRKLTRTFKHINDRLEASIAAWSFPSQPR